MLDPSQTNTSLNPQWSNFFVFVCTLQITIIIIIIIMCYIFLCRNIIGMFALIFPVLNPLITRNFKSAAIRDAL
jgi:hypothetical protein